MTRSTFLHPGAVILVAAIVLMLTPLIAFAQPVNTATIEFTAPTKRIDGTNITGALTYKVFQGVQGQTKTLVGTISTTTSTINTGLLGNTTYCWQVSALEGGTSESALSNEACKTFPASSPQAVTITVR